jgi:hypothetical protein
MESAKKEICNNESLNNIKEELKVPSQIKNILKNDEISFEDENEYKRIKEELEKYKKEQEKEVEDLEKELAQLKEENAKYNNVIINDGNNNILLDENTIETLKKDIIKEIEPKLNEEFKNMKISIKENLNSFDKENKTIIDTNYKNINSKIENLKKEIEEKYLKNKNLIESQNQINKNLSPDKNAQEIKDKTDEKKRVGMKNHNKNQINNIHSFNNKKSDNNTQVKNNNNYPQNILGVNLQSEKEKAVGLKENNTYYNFIQGNQNKKNETNNDTNLFNLFNNIFFKNKEQTSVNGEIINKKYIDKINEIFLKYKKEKKEILLINYFDNFIKTCVVNIFKRKDLVPKIIENVKSNIETLLVYFGLERYKYQRYYYPELLKNENIKNRKKSVEAAGKFRKIFNIGKHIINDEQLLIRLDENDNDINKVFQQMYG